MPNAFPNNIIVAHSLSKIFSDNLTVPVVAVRSLDLEISTGEFIIISGPNGGGKTTLLTLLGCMSRPSSGSVSIINTNVLSLSQKELSRFRMKNIGFIFQTFRLVDFLTVRQNVELAAHIAGTTGLEASNIVSSLMDEVEISHRANFYPQQLSGGEKQRTAIARALVNNPAIILADEPTGSLDSSSGKIIIRLLRELSKERNTTVIIVSHDERIYSYADRVLRMEDGAILVQKK
ncbi:MAG: ABC transporter ATP-binding protein [Bacteroidota bacterium]